MPFKTLSLLLLVSAALVLGGCTTVAGVTNPGAIEENYGKRTLGAQVEDESIETKIAHNLRRRDARLGDARINVDSYNGVVLLTGQVPSQELKQKATEVASEVRNVRDVHNELAIAANLPASQRLSDTWLNTRIRTSLATDETIDTGRLRFITENASVYVMGIVTRAESDRIVDAISRIGGVQRIVKVFDYLD
ncbi:BON domain-containing protein [Halomonas campisalis]|uniref:BON domain-containing protein n=1 Tax=Billgrantia campisalis TaxID=74661 RepID=A0ABS9P3S8_9GAMM|nr:BON domain-containing protein [Halomonas campisalis]MCG6656440.1 BON domain-containing protein [Halomonas campisalis]MDR5861626.1 BON domain-containing protein [Halomonas campisalis]